MENLKAIIEEKLATWELAGQPLDVQTEALRGVLQTRILTALENNDRVEEIVTYEGLYEPVALAITLVGPTPEFVSKVLRDDATQDQLENVKAFVSEACRAVNIRPVSLDEIVSMAADSQIPPEVFKRVPPEELFIQPVTSAMKTRMLLNWWSNQVGLTQALREMNAPIEPTFEELRLLFLFFTMNEALAKRQKVQVASASALGGVNNHPVFKTLER